MEGVIIQLLSSKIERIRIGQTKVEITFTLGHEQIVLKKCDLGKVLVNLIKRGKESPIARYNKECLEKIIREM